MDSIEVESHSKNEVDNVSWELNEACMLVSAASYHLVNGIKYLDFRCW